MSEKIDWQKLMPRRGFEILLRGWVVYRTLARPSHRWMGKAYERRCRIFPAY